MNRETLGSNTGEADQYNTKSQLVPIELMFNNDNNNENNNSHNNNTPGHNNNDNTSDQQQRMEEGIHWAFLPPAPVIIDEERSTSSNTHDNSNNNNNNSTIEKMSKRILEDIIPREFPPTAPLRDSDLDQQCPELRSNEILEGNIYIFSPSVALSIRSTQGTTTPVYNTTPTTETTTLHHRTAGLNAENSTRRDPSSNHTTNARETISRVSLPRSSKTKALEQIRAMTNSLPSDAREIPHSQMPNVELRIGQSTIEGAGTGLFLMSGPQPDGTAHAGDRLGTYEGARYTDPEDLDRMRSSQVVSDYLYEAIDPFTDTTVIVDATPPFSCYGRYANDGLDEFEANSILEFDEEGEVILTALTTIEPGAELFLSYGVDYWADQARYDSLPLLTQQRIKKAYPDIDRHLRGTAALRDAFGIVLAPPPLRAGVVGASSIPSTRKRTKKVRTPAPISSTSSRDSSRNRAASSTPPVASESPSPSGTTATSRLPSHSMTLARQPSYSATH